MVTPPIRLFLNYLKGNRKENLGGDPKNAQRTKATSESAEEGF